MIFQLYPQKFLSFLITELFNDSLRILLPVIYGHKHAVEKTFFELLYKLLKLVLL